MTSKGFLVVIPDYRVYPDVLFPAFVEDAAHAFRWAKDHAGEFGGDPARVFVMGHSAGAHIAALLTYDQHFLNGVGLHERSIRGFIGLAGPYDFLPLTDERFKIIFGPEPGRAASQPINFVDGNEAPALLVYGGKDTVVAPRNIANMTRRIQEKGGKVTELLYPEMTHVTAVLDIAAPLRKDKDLLDRIAAFVEAN